MSKHREHLSSAFVQMTCLKKYDFTDKIALITGSSGHGIGAAIAIQLAQCGALLTITGRRADNLARVAREIERISGRTPLQMIGDLEHREFIPKLIEATLEKYGRLDILINNAAFMAPDANLANPNLLQLFDRMINVNVRAIVQLVQLAVPHLERTKGNIVNISSISSLRPRSLGYSTSKAALDMATKCMALELGPRNVRVNSVNPGRIYRGWGQELSEQDEQFNRMLEEKVAPQSALQRNGSPEDIANLVLFLASDQGANITGSIMVSDSGRTLVT